MSYFSVLCFTSKTPLTSNGYQLLQGCNILSLWINWGKVLKLWMRRVPKLFYVVRYGHKGVEIHCSTNLFIVLQFLCTEFCEIPFLQAPSLSAVGFSWVGFIQRSPWQYHPAIRIWGVWRANNMLQWSRTFLTR